MNIPPSKHASFFTTQNGGYSQIGCTKMDINNFFGNERNETWDYDIDQVNVKFERY